MFNKWNIFIMDMIKKFIRPFFNFLYLSSIHRLLSCKNPHIALHSLLDENIFDAQDPNLTLINDIKSVNYLLGKRTIFEVSLDDGYKDNIKFTKLLYEKKEIISTIFIATRFIYEDEWQFNFDLWNYLVFSKINNPKKEFIRLKNYLKHLELNEQKNWFKQRDWLISIRSPIPFMTTSELSNLSKKKYVEICLHGHSHISYANLSLKEAINDIEKSRSLLKKNDISYNPTKFAFPFGDLPTKFSIDEFMKLANLTELYGTSPYSSAVRPRLLYWNE
jgi:peptidoglycan/xylan/chitin deacetylase (PgdA/CDA1 family)